MSIKEAIIKKFLGKRMYHPFLITDSDTATVFPVQDEFSVSAEYMIEKHIKSVPMYDREYNSILRQPDNYIDLRVVTVLRTTKNRIFCHRGSIYCPAQPIEHTDRLNVFDTYMLGGKSFMSEIFKDTRLIDAVKSTTPTFRGGMITYDRYGHKIALLLNVIVIKDEEADKAYSDYLKPEYSTSKWSFKHIDEAHYLTNLERAIREQLPKVKEEE